MTCGIETRQTGDSLHGQRNRHARPARARLSPGSGGNQVDAAWLGPVRFRYHTVYLEAL